jgi:putative restriction endonuclease
LLREPEADGVRHGRQLLRLGWKIDVSDGELTHRIHPKSHIGELRGLLPQKCSPLRANGDGLQSVYLAEVGRPFAAALFRLIGGEANQVKDVAKEVDRAEQLSPSREPDLERWEERVEHDIREDTMIPDTQREAIILALGYEWRSERWQFKPPIH